jgi:hypothetical protein
MQMNGTILFHLKVKGFNIYVNLHEEDCMKRRGSLQPAKAHLYICVLFSFCKAPLANLILRGAIQILLLLLLLLLCANYPIPTTVTLVKVTDAFHRGKLCDGGLYCPKVWCMAQLDKMSRVTTLHLYNIF